MFFQSGQTSGISLLVEKKRLSASGRCDYRGEAWVGCSQLQLVKTPAKDNDGMPRKHISKTWSQDLDHTAPDIPALEILGKGANRFQLSFKPV